MKAIAITAIGSFIVAIMFSVPAIFAVAEQIDFFVQDAHHDELEVRPLEGDAAIIADLTSYGFEALLMLPLILPVLVVAIASIKASQFLVTNRVTIGWVAGTAAVVASLYLIPCFLLLIAIPEEALRLAPLIIALIASVGLIATAANRSNQKVKQGGDGDAEEAV